ncbi:hypothetical protein FA95DRAFT_619712 [Auriscalpium vulgare]|uniref:Uncharacterized protein n=1 Tax=Auriscalpium vulgare TaxID=40419 RepID=A0ACB8S2Y1_9AGAM|nr:hypothetical protein FA95DRAFT_619712 [Auriscalpium vulgare]
MKPQHLSRLSLSGRAASCTMFLQHIQLPTSAEVSLSVDNCDGSGSAGSQFFAAVSSAIQLPARPAVSLSISSTEHGDEIRVRRLGSDQSYADDWSSDCTCDPHPSDLVLSFRDESPTNHRDAVELSSAAFDAFSSPHLLQFSIHRKSPGWTTDTPRDLASGLRAPGLRSIFVEGDPASGLCWALCEADACGESGQFMPGLARLRLAGVDLEQAVMSSADGVRVPLWRLLERALVGRAGEGYLLEALDLDTGCRIHAESVVQMRHNLPGVFVNTTEPHDGREHLWYARVHIAVAFHFLTGMILAFVRDRREDTA